MTLFRKFPSIENHYQKGHINAWLKYHPELTDLQYVIQEKIHGSNLQLSFIPHSDTELGRMVIGTRNNVLPGDDSFFGVRACLENYKTELDILQAWADALGVIVRVYGEFFGGNIQKGVNYGKDKRFLIFDMEQNGKWLSFVEMAGMLAGLGLDHMIVPVLGVVNGLEEALAFDPNRQSTLFETEERNIMEGVVIKLYDTVIVDGHGSPFVLKHKTQEFMDKKSAKRVPREKTEWREEVEEARETFLEYLNETRVQSVISKNGKVTKEKFGDYIRLVMQDAKETFAREEGFNEADYTKEELRYITNAGKTVAQMLQEYL